MQQVCAVVKRVSPKRDLNGVQEAGFTACSAVDRYYEVLRGSMLSTDWKWK
jgi:hypothetical protein